MSLARIQDQFQQYVLAGDREQPAIAGLIDESHGLAARDRLAIYYDAYRIRLKEALAEAFDKTY
ncbi:MAG: putative DNA-binding domain-containing protein, partial [Burkholderiaceae bacterium]|nr:putative DNA-binding domain-containing protein [Burkholderiaceae bacterium]